MGIERMSRCTCFSPLTIFLGLDLQYPFLHLCSPDTYLSLSLKTRILVLYTLIAYSVAVAGLGSLVVVWAVVVVVPPRA